MSGSSATTSGFFSSTTVSFFIGVSPFFVVIERIRHLIQLLKTQHLAKTQKFLLPATLVVLIAVFPAYSEEQARWIMPLGEKNNPEKNTQDSRTMSRSVLPPTGYNARKQDKRSAQGKVLYARFNCAQCHSINGEGGEIGPPLDGIGGHRGRQWLTARVLDPEKQRADFPEIFGSRPNLMPHTIKNLKEAESLADFLLTLEEPKKGFSVAHHAMDGDTNNASEEPLNKNRVTPVETDASKSGRELFSNLHCAACHSLDGSQDRFGPDLAGIGSRLSDKKLEKILSGAVRSAVMKKQTQNLGDEHIYDIKSFLLTLPQVQSDKTK